MCRLLGFAAAGSNTSLNGVLGMQAVRDFRNLSEIHNDGWGSALVTVPSESPYLRDGGAPTPETGTAIYKNTIAARHDPIFDELANTPARGGLWHLRLASSNLPFYIYQRAFLGFDVGQAAAMGVVTVIATIIVSTLALRLIFKSFTGNEEAA